MNKKRQELFNYLSEECEFIALESNLQDIEEIVLKNTTPSEPSDEVIKEKIIEIKNSGSKEFPFYQILVDKKEYCLTDTIEKAEILKILLSSTKQPQVDWDEIEWIKTEINLLMSKNTYPDNTDLKKLWHKVNDFIRKNKLQPKEDNNNTK